MFTLDTNILIYYSAGDEKVAAFLHRNREQIFYLPTIAAAEFLSHPRLDAETTALFKIFLTQTIPIGLDLGLAERAAQIRRLYGLKLADAVIAATAALTKSSLVTRNVRDFRKIKELPLIEI